MSRANSIRSVHSAAGSLAGPLQRTSSSGSVNGIASETLLQFHRSAQLLDVIRLGVMLVIQRRACLLITVGTMEYSRFAR